MTNPTTTNNPTQAVFERCVARHAVSPGPHRGRLVHVMWSAPRQGDRLVQLYVDGQLAATTRTTSQREAWLMIEPIGQTAIELLAVPPHCSARAMPERLAGVDPALLTSIDLSLLRDVGLPIGSRVAIRVDDDPSEDRKALFAPGDPRGGFGAVFAEGGFGYDASTGPGLGLGDLGFGPLGTDGRALRWTHRTLRAETHAIRVSLTDADGQPAANDLVFDADIDRLPASPTGVTLDDDFTLSWNPDDA
ncbi:MAG: hypothetical protein ACPGYV_01785 [Phycisphaeraceae bacterium]